MFLLNILKPDTHNENICDQCGEEFVNHKDLIAHARHIHHHPIMKCHECVKSSFTRKIDFIMLEKNI